MVRKCIDCGKVFTSKYHERCMECTKKCLIGYMELIPLPADWLRALTKKESVKK